MSPRSYTLNSIRAELRDGKAPIDIKGAVCLGSGSYRTAYRVGRFVVKNSCNSAFTLKEDIRAAGFRVAPTVKACGYDIQLAYEPANGRSDYTAEIRRRAGEIEGDLHSGNLGFDRRNRPIAFDW